MKINLKGKLKWNSKSKNIFLGFIRFYSNQKRNLEEHLPINFFEKNEKISLKRKANENKLYYVFIDGPTGAGKNEMKWRLDKTGYRTFSIPYLSFYINNKEARNEEIGKKYVSELFNVVNDLGKDFKNGGKFKDNLVFILRSPLSPFLCGTENLKEFCLQQNNNLRKQIDDQFSIIVTMPDPLKQILRTSERIHLESDQERLSVRKDLFREDDEEFLLKQNETFHKFMENNPDIIDRIPSTGVLFSTSTKQAVANLLSTVYVKKMTFPLID
eukprot:TRINITY_DN17141_c0_g1_i1.p1 TRINITY_DN17141_c0_g1~~TRINITY_DN17141_c0_g1_i1.p1  ORF type:complete len:271 (-),score=64.86 TRINITY_DN17141_c0_g1_i1:68-880(-)